MLTADRTIALGFIAFSLFCMWHATALPIGWDPGNGPGGGAFPFWLSAVMLAASSVILLRSFQPANRRAGPFVDPDTLRPVLLVIGATTVTIALMPIAGAYVALTAFLFWYLRIFGRHGWTLTLAICAATPVFLFFFFEVTLKILLPKGVTEPLFIPLYAAFF